MDLCFLLIYRRKKKTLARTSSLIIGTLMIIYFIRRWIYLHICLLQNLHGRCPIELKTVSPMSTEVEENHIGLRLPNFYSLQHGMNTVQASEIRTECLSWESIWSRIIWFKLYEFKMPFHTKYFRQKLTLDIIPTHIIHWTTE